MKCFAAVAFSLGLAVNSTVAGDWPQILGPDRNAIARGESLADRWPDDGPKVLWEHAVGQGFAGPAVAGNRVVVVHRVDGQERVEALDAKTGKPLWQTGFPATYRGGISPDNGPRCVPLIHDGYVYLHGAQGDLHCVSLETGQTRWSRPALDKRGVSTIVHIV